MKRRGKWVIILVAFDDLEIDAEVLKERIPLNEDEQLAALLRGGELLAVLDEFTTEDQAEGCRREFQKECLR